MLKVKNRYYFRMKIPAELVEKVRLPELKRSLGTSNSKLARTQARAYAYRADKLFCLLRSGILADTNVPDYLRENFPSKRKPTLHAPAERLVSDAVTDYLKEKEFLGSWTTKTMEENKAILKRFVELVKDCTLVAVDRKIMIDAVALLSKLPPNVGKIPRFAGMELTEVAALQDVTPMTSRSVNKYLNRIGGFFLWCQRQGYADRNPTQGLSIKRTENAYEERATYDKGDLQRLVDSLVSVPHSNPERFWIPLIGIYTGLRQNEICQLLVEDIVEEDGVICFDINGKGDKRLKTLASKRLVPLHPLLIDLGFLDYKRELAAKKEVRLWPNLVHTRDGYIRVFVNWYYRHNRRYITKDPKKTFHSLRHSFADCLKQKVVNETMISELMGHTNKSMTTGRYGKRFQPRLLLAVIQQVSYEINLDGIFYMSRTLLI